MTRVLCTLAVSLVLAGCHTIPVKVKFPDAPKDASECVPLKPLQDNPALSDVSKTVAANYGSYRDCAAKLSTWTEWYHDQKKIFEGVTK